MTQARLLRALVEAHVKNGKPQLRQPRSFAAADLRELSRIGNNVNQIAHQANLMLVHVVANRAEQCLAELDKLLRRLAT